jgi:hypothetical protein
MSYSITVIFFNVFFFNLVSNSHIQLTWDILNFCYENFTTAEIHKNKHLFIFSILYVVLKLIEYFENKKIENFFALFNKYGKGLVDEKEISEKAEYILRNILIK